MHLINSLSLPFLFSFIFAVVPFRSVSIKLEQTLSSDVIRFDKTGVRVIIVIIVIIIIVFIIVVNKGDLDMNLFSIRNNQSSVI